MMNMYFVVTCPSLPILPNGEVDYNRSPINGQFFEGTTATFTCNSGYSRFGDASRTCLTSRDWSEETPTCRGKKSSNNTVGYVLWRNYFLSGKIHT